MFYLLTIGLAGLRILRARNKIHAVKLKTSDTKERINLLNHQISSEFKNRVACGEKKERYGSLKDVIETLNKSLELDEVGQALVSQAFSRIASDKGKCLLYLVDEKKKFSLSLFKSRKQNPDLAVKNKEGDIFDLWCLRHARPLLVEDIKSDFRFDPDKLKGDASRDFSSLICAPLVTEQRLLGVLRLDCPQGRAYNQDDLRFLTAICDLGAVALENAQLYNKTQELAIHDELTSLCTKGFFLERLKDQYRRSIHNKEHFSVMMLDIDHFKKYNDTFGHTAGDIVLKTIAQVISVFFRGMEHTVSRFGGEEFCVALPGLNKNKVCDLAEELLHKIETTPIVLRKEKTHVTVSIGVAVSSGADADQTGMILKADRAMYQAKQEGRNRVVWAQP